MSQLFFISGKLLSPQVREDLRIPLHFISFAHTDGRMYTTLRNTDTFVAKGLRPHGNSVVYGALYLLEDDFFHVRTLDAMHLCSKSALGHNHSLDTNHRIIDECTLISFNTLDELNRLQYRETQTLKVNMYVGNQTNSQIQRRIKWKYPKNYRVSNGVHEKYFLQQWEVN